MVQFVQLNPETIQAQVLQIKDEIAKQVIEEARKLNVISNNEDLEVAVMEKSEHAFEIFKEKVGKEFEGSNQTLAMIFANSVKKYFYAPDLLQKQVMALFDEFNQDPQN